MSLPPAAELAQLPRDRQAAALGLLFEPCPALVELALPAAADAASWPQIIERVRARLHELSTDDPRVSAIVAAHPRLGARRVDSAQSRAEQASLQAGAGSAGGDGEAAALARANAAYERAFPGLRYVVFVNGRPRAAILADMARRTAEGDYAREVARAFDAMCDIAQDRQGNLQVDVKTRI